MSGGYLIQPALIGKLNAVRDAQRDERGGYIVPEPLASRLMQANSVGLAAITRKITVAYGEDGSVQKYSFATRYIFKDCVIERPSDGDRSPRWEWSEVKLTADECRFYGVPL